MAQYINSASISLEAQRTNVARAARESALSSFASPLPSTVLTRTSELQLLVRSSKSSSAAPYTGVTTTVLTSFLAHEWNNLSHWDIFKITDSTGFVYFFFFNDKELVII